MKNWTKENIPDLTGKVVIVTGANVGLGYESTLGLAEHNAQVIMACRNLDRGKRAMESIYAYVPTAQLDLMKLDLASLVSIRNFASGFKSKYDQLDVLMNNAGLMGIPHREVTEDGFEMQFGINYLGHFALTGLLIEVLLNTPASRVVSVSSRMHLSSKMDWDDLMMERSYHPWEAYKRSKLANLLFIFELQRRLAAVGAQTTAVGAHPGFSDTNWHSSLGTINRFLMKILSPLGTQSAAMGALPQLYASVAPDAKPGGYYGPEKDRRGYPVEARASDAAYDEMDARKLWEISEALTGVRYELNGMGN